MGTVIGADAARDDIVSDTKKAVAAAQAKGGETASSASERLGPVIGLYEAQFAEAKANADKAVAARARRSEANRAADEVVVEVADDLFEAGGRRRNDPYLALVIPGGASPITDVAVDLQPIRMRVTARLLKSAKHPRIPQATLESAGQRLDDAAAALDQALIATRDDLVNDDVSDKVLTTLARVMRTELVALKRQWIGAGWSESEVHEIIPDRPAAKPVKKEGEA